MLLGFIPHWLVLEQSLKQVLADELVFDLLPVQRGALVGVDIFFPIPQEVEDELQQRLVFYHPQPLQ
jgi:hypothetical protein